MLNWCSAGELQKHSDFTERPPVCQPLWSEMNYANEKFGPGFLQKPLGRTKLWRHSSICIPGTASPLRDNTLHFLYSCRHTSIYSYRLPFSFFLFDILAILLARREHAAQRAVSVICGMLNLLSPGCRCCQLLARKKKEKKCIFQNVGAQISQTVAYLFPHPCVKGAAQSGNSPWLEPQCLWELADFFAG